MASIKSMECPFTWETDIEKIFNLDFTNHNESYLESYLRNPVIPLIYSTVRTFGFVIQGNLDGAKTLVDETIKLWNTFNKEQLEKEDEVSKDVLEHIVNATSYHVYLRTGQIWKAQEIMNKLKDSVNNFKENIHFATIYGSKAIATSVYNDRENSICFARKAIKITPNCPVWHYVLGRNLRVLRRDNTFVSPSKEEISSLEKAYSLSKIPQYGIKLATVYRESKKMDDAERVYSQVYESNPADHVIQSRLALFFIRRGSEGDMIKAKSCLEYAEKLAPNESIVNHYYGIYFYKKKQLKIASEFFKKSAESGNFGADIQYGECMAKLDENFDYLHHLKDMSEKYKDQKAHQQKIFFYIGFHIFHSSPHVMLAMKYILEGIDCNPLNYEMFERYYCNFKGQLINIYDFTKCNIIPELEKKLNSSKAPVARISEDLLRKFAIILEKYEAYKVEKVSSDLKNLLI